MRLAPPLSTVDLTRMARRRSVSDLQLHRFQPAGRGSGGPLNVQHVARSARRRDTNISSSGIAEREYHAVAPHEERKLPADGILISLIRSASPDGIHLPLKPGAIKHRLQNCIVKL